jgi:hypothetical protein
MEPPMDADPRQSKLSAKTGENPKPHRSAFGDEAMNRLKFRICVHRRASAVSSLLFGLRLIDSESLRSEHHAP